jgi:hypothetical protein
LQQAPGTFAATGSLHEPHYGGFVVPLKDGRVLVAGGMSCWSPTQSGCEYSDQVEIYDQASDRFQVTGSLTTPRESAAATVLKDGSVLIVGGYVCSVWPSCTWLASSEVYDPSTGQSVASGSLSQHLIGLSATLLPDSRVLVAGGTSCTSQQSHCVAATTAAETYDPASGKFSPVGSMAVGRIGATLTLLENGQVLVAGGITNGFSTADAEIFDPSTNKFHETGSLVKGRMFHSATLLSSGRVLITGGETSGRPIFTSEIYDPVSGRFSASGDLLSTQRRSTAALLPDGTVLVAGDGTATSAEIYDPVTGEFRKTGSMTGARVGPASAALPGGRVLVLGGLSDYGGQALLTAEVYQF